MEASICRRGLVISVLLSLIHVPASLAADTTVSISDAIPSDVHSCISRCINYDGVVGDDVNDIGSILACGTPYENDCWCATATPSASAVSKFINSCASDKCSAGDLSRDIDSIRDIYAGYCLDAGYTQPIVSKWHTTSEEPSTDEGDSSTAEPSKTKDPGPAQTTTELTVVTQTTEDGAGGSKVVVGVTSTIWKNSEGSIVSGPGGGKNDSGGNKVALGAGLGVGLAAALAIAGVGIWMCMRRRKKRANASVPESHMAPTPQMQEGGSPSGSPAVQQTIGRKPVATQADKAEMAGQGVARELSGRDTHPLPDMSPSPPVAVAGQHEMLADTRQQQHYGAARDTAPTWGQHEMAAESRPQEMTGSQYPRYELGGQC